MTDTLKAADLNRHHLGRTVRVSQGEAQFTDILSGVTHKADLIDESRLGEEVPTFVLGPGSTTLTFMYAGAVQIDGRADVEMSR